MLKKPLNDAHHFMSNGVSVARFRDMERRLAIAERENIMLKRIIKKDAAVREFLKTLNERNTRH